MTAVPRRTMAVTRFGFPPWAQGVSGVLLLAAAFEIVPQAGIVPAAYLPPLHQVLAALATEAGRPLFWFSLYETLRGWAIGLALAPAAALAPRHLKRTRVL
jgi:ABC-type nitrate/sulfonate/bicarbonate transport system permease component